MAHTWPLSTPTFDLPGAAYDMCTEDGKRYYGNWELSNYLNFRLENHAAGVGLREAGIPYPAPSLPGTTTPNEERYDPLDDLGIWSCLLVSLPTHSPGSGKALPGTLKRRGPLYRGAVLQRGES